MASPPLILHPLLLAGGKSTRMGSPKHLLIMPDGRPLYQHQLDVLRSVCPGAPKVYISLAQDTEMDDLLRMAADSSKRNGGNGEWATEANSDIKAILDLERNVTDESAGPAAGLMAAFENCPQATWLVIACDYPFITTAALNQLRSVYNPPVTCIRNPEGFIEPLLGIWSPQALGKLKENCNSGKSSPSKVVSELGGLTISPSLNSAMLLHNVNTGPEWEVALKNM